MESGFGSSFLRSVLGSLLIHGVGVMGIFYFISNPRKILQLDQSVLELTLVSRKEALNLAPPKRSPLRRSGSKGIVPKGALSDHQEPSSGSEFLAGTELPSWTESRVPPDYPVLARKRGWEGNIVIQIETDADGKVASLEVLKKSEFPVLNERAVSAVRQWRTRPLAKIVVPVEFRLK